MLPLVFGILICWLHRKLTRFDLISLAPFAAIAIALTIVNIWFQTHGSGEVFRSGNLADRIAGTGAIPWFYVSKAILPINLLFIYPQWNIQTDEIRWWIPLAMTVIVSLLLYYFRNSHWGRPLFAAWAIFLVALMPVAGLVNVGFMRYSLVADRYLHFAVIPIVTVIASAWTLSLLLPRSAYRTTSLFAGLLVLAAFSFLSRQQADLFANPWRLYEATLSVNPDCWLLENNLGVFLESQGDLRGAIAHYQRS